MNEKQIENINKAITIFVTLDDMVSTLETFGQTLLSHLNIDNQVKADIKGVAITTVMQRTFGDNTKQQNDFLDAIDLLVSDTNEDTE